MKGIVLMAAAAALSAAPVAAQTAPIADHHQHLFSPVIAAELARTTPGFHTITASDVIALLDSAGIRQALLLSVAYIYGSPSRSFDDEYGKVRAENDWNAAQAAQYPDRLIAFCGFNPLKDYALAELERCARNPNLRRGIKLHFGNSDVQLENPAHVTQLRRIFRAANTHHMAIVVHMRASISKKRPYGALLYALSYPPPRLSLARGLPQLLQVSPSHENNVVVLQCLPELGAVDDLVITLAPRRPIGFMIHHHRL